MLLELEMLSRRVCRQSCGGRRIAVEKPVMGQIAAHGIKDKGQSSIVAIVAIANEPVTGLEECTWKWSGRALSAFGKALSAGTRGVLYISGKSPARLSCQP